MGNFRGPILRWLDGESIVPDAAEAATARAETAERRVAELEALLAGR